MTQFAFAFDVFQSHQLARKNNPVTSHSAATRVREFASGHEELILSVLALRGAHSVHEIATFCSLTAHEAGKRMRKLEREQRICVATTEQGDEITRPTPAGRQARVWRLA